MKTVFGFLVAMMFVQTVSAAPTMTPHQMGLQLPKATNDSSEPLPTCPILRKAEVSVGVSRTRWVQKDESWEAHTTILCNAKGIIDVYGVDKACTWQSNPVVTCENEENGKKEDVNVFGTIAVSDSGNIKEKSFGLGFYANGEKFVQNFNSASTKTLDLKDLSLWTASPYGLTPPGASPADSIGVSVTFEDMNASAK